MNCVYYYISSHQDNVRIIICDMVFMYERIFLWLECVKGKNDNAVFQEQIWHYFRLTLLETTGIVVFKKYIYYEETILMDVHVL